MKKELYIENIWQNIKVIDAALRQDMLLFKEVLKETDPY